MAEIAVFLDRDGTIVDDPGYLNHPDQVKLLDGAAEALRELAGLGYKLVIVSNQSAVARGMVTEEMLERIHERLEEMLAAQGAAIDEIYYCPYHPDGVIPEYSRPHVWRKPEPGMLLAAADDLDIDLSSSWMVGDKPSDVQAGHKAGCRTILLRSGPAVHGAETGEPDHIAANIREAANMIKKFHRDPQHPVQPPANEVDDDSDVEADDEAYTVTPKEAEEITGGPLKADVTPSGAAPSLSDPETSQLLADILEQLKRMQKSELYGEFSIMRLLAGIVQVFVPFCLMLALWLFLSPKRDYNTIYVALGFAVALQTMALTFYVMQDRR